MKLKLCDFLQIESEKELIAKQQNTIYPNINEPIYNKNLLDIVEIKPNMYQKELVDDFVLKKMSKF